VQRTSHIKAPLDTVSEDVYIKTSKTFTREPQGGHRPCRVSSCLEYGAGGEGKSTPCAYQPGTLQAGEFGQERGREGAWNGGSSESIFTRILTPRHPVHAYKSVAMLCMLYNSSTHAMKARLPLHVLKYTCTLQNTHVCLGSLVELTFLQKVE